MQLRSNVRVLTVDHQRMIERDGLIEARESASLIQQLRGEITGASVMERTGTSAGGFTPINIGALDVMDKIASDLKAEMRPWCMIPDTSRLEGSIHTWAFLVQRKEDLIGPAAVASGKWVKAITGLLEPVKMITIPGDCPKCGITPDDNGKLNEDDHWVQVPPLTVTKDMESAKCAMCEYEWWGRDKVIELGQAVQQMAEAVPRNMQG